MKLHQLLYATAVGGALCLSPLTRAADTWTFSIEVTSNWDTAIWTKNGTPQEAGIFPQANDDIVKLTGSNTTLYLNGDRTFDTLETSGGIVHLRSGKNNSNFAARLTVNTINVTGSTLSFSNRQPETAPLTVRTGQVNLTGGNLAIGNYSSGGSPYATEFTVSGTTTIGSGRTLGVMSPLFTKIDLGALTLNGTLNLAWSTGSSSTNGNVDFTSNQPYTVEVSGLSSTDEVGLAGTITTSVLREGTAPRPILLISGDTEATSTYHGVIEDGVPTAQLAIRKEGDSVQRFSRTDGNTYSGGTVVAGGTLTAQNGSGGSAFGTGAIVVEDGGTLAAYYRMRIELGDGQSITVRDGGTLSAGYGGTPAIALLTLSGNSNGSAPTLIMEEGAAFSFRLNTLTGSGDRMLFTEYGAGDLLLNTNVVNVTGLDGVGSWELFSFDADISGEAWWNNNALILGTGFEQWAGLASFRYEDRAIYLDVIPEPGSTALLALVLGGSILFKLRSRFLRSSV